MEKKHFNEIADGVKLVESGVVDSTYFFQRILIPVLAKQEDAIPMLLQILHKERTDKESLLLEMNHELSRADTYLREQKMFNQQKDFALGNIDTFYEKHKDVISHCYRVKEKEA